MLPPMTTAWLPVRRCSFESENRAFIGTPPSRVTNIIDGLRRWSVVNCQRHAALPGVDVFHSHRDMQHCVDNSFSSAKIFWRDFLAAYGMAQSPGKCGACAGAVLYCACS